MRVITLLTAMMAAGCASQPPPQTHLSTAPVPAPTSTPYISPSGAAQPTGDVEAQRLAAAKNLNLKVFNKDGQQLFCRSNLVTGSHIQRDTRCYTAEQLDSLEREVQRQADEFLVAPNSQNPARLPTTK